MKKLVLLALAALPLLATAQTIPSYVPTSGLVGWWPFNGNANDESGNGNNGTVNGATLTIDRLGNPNSAFANNVASGNIQISGNVIDGLGSFFISGWFRANTNQTGVSDIFQIDANSPCSIYPSQTPNPNNNLYVRYDNGTSSFYFCTQINSTIRQFVVPVVPSLNTWHQFCFNYNGASIEYYLDGVLLSSLPLSGVFNSYSQPLFIANWCTYEDFSGDVDDFGIWNRALTPCEIQALYNSGTGPTAAVSAASAICLGDTTALNASGASTYLWMPGNLIGSSVNVTPNATTTYTVTGTDVNGCVSSDTVSVTINSLPVVAAVSTVGSICEGQSDTLLASGAQSYLWSTGGFAAQEVVAPLTTTTYSLTGTDINGCSNTATVTVNVNLLPSIAATSSSDTVCLGLSTTLTALGASSYIWSSGGTAATEIVTPAASTTYTVYGTDINGCMDTATISVTVNSLPAVSAASSAATFCEADANGALVGLPAQGTWSGPGVTGNSFNPATAGTGTHNVVYTYTDNNGCSNSDTLTMTVDLCTGLTEETNSSFTVFPNPANNNITVTWATPNVNTLTLSDATGRAVRTYNVTGTQAQLSLEGLASGVYFLSVGGEEKAIQMIIKN
jgi:hypothetical protein